MLISKGKGYPGPVSSRITKSESKARQIIQNRLAAFKDANSIRYSVHETRPLGGIFRLGWYILHV